MSCLLWRQHLWSTVQRVSRHFRILISRLTSNSAVVTSMLQSTATFTTGIDEVPVRAASSTLPSIFCQRNMSTLLGPVLTRPVSHLRRSRSLLYQMRLSTNVNNRMMLRTITKRSRMPNSSTITDVARLSVAMERLSSLPTSTRLASNKNTRSLSSNTSFKKSRKMRRFWFFTMSDAC